jgi:hypothetical protein
VGIRGGGQMPRAGQMKPAVQERLSDRIAIGLLTRTYPVELVDEVVAATGRAERRHRLLPARVVVYYVLAMALFAEQAYEEVAQLLTHGLGWASRWRGSWRVPSKSAIAQGRARLGPEPLAMLFARAVRPLATEATRGAWYRGRRLMAIDEACLAVADTPANEAAFGRPGSGRGQESGASPQVRMVGLAEAGIYALVDAVIGPYPMKEMTLAAGLAGSCAPGMLVMVNRGFPTAMPWRQLTAGGADLLWRTKSHVVLPVDHTLPDGSYLSHIKAADDRAGEPVMVRVVEHAPNDLGRLTSEAPYRLVTSILDPAEAPTTELAALYAQRWEFQTALDELKAHQRGAGLVLRSKTPEGVYQEIYGHLLVHYAIRVLMHDVALQADHDTDRIGFYGL